MEIGGSVVVNLALGGTTCLQNLYKLNRKRNQEILKNADLIISNSNTGDIGAHLFWKQNTKLSQIYRYLSWLFKNLYFLNKKSLFLIYPFYVIQIKFAKKNNTII